MVPLLALSLAALLAPAPAPQRETASVAAPVQAPRDTADSTRRARRAPPRRPVTAEHLATAFDDARARDLLARIRVARLADDSTIHSYDAHSYERMSIGLGTNRFVRDRLFMRTERAARIRWERGRGAWVDVLGSREAFPAVAQWDKGEPEIDEGDEDDVELPFYPGSESLWIGGGLARAEVDERWIVHPLAAGAEAYYRYAVGDSTTLRLPDGRVFRLIELRVLPREPLWRLFVGSFWVDAATARPVRAAYRPSVPIDVWTVLREEGEEDDLDEVPAPVRALITPLVATITAITVEYGLEESRWWLPRLQSAEAEVRIGMMRAPFTHTRRYTYDSVNGAAPVPELAEMVRRVGEDSLARARAGGDSARRMAHGGSGDHSRHRESCDESGTRQTVKRRGEGTVLVVFRIPCDEKALTRSAALPPSIYAPDEEVFAAEDLASLRKEVERLGVQADWEPQHPSVRWRPRDGLLRYNRVEGLSAGLAVDAVLGRGYSARATARVGTPSHHLDGELALVRSAGRQELRAAAYRRVNAVDDWGMPLGFGASVNALVFGRDDGFYYRSLGLELSGAGARNGRLTWRLFGEKQWDALVSTHWSLARAVRDARFADNVDATDGYVVGLALRSRAEAGSNPRDVRLLVDTRLEGAAGDLRYGRGATDLTLTHGVGRRVATALTVGAGSSLGTIPPQRRWHIGGAHTVRGHAPGAAAGDAYWMARAEAGVGRGPVRPTLFADVGWAGDRRAWRTPGRPLSGAGLGLTVLDGLVRVDVARPLATGGWRAELYLDARF